MSVYARVSKCFEACVRVGLRGYVRTRACAYIHVCTSARVGVRLVLGTLVCVSVGADIRAR